jgi:predicted ATPase
VPREGFNDTSKLRMALIDELLCAKRATGQKTFIFDEPESGFSLPWQAGLWASIFAKLDPNEFQVLVATHSPFALGISGANYIEMSPGYVRECEVAVLPLMTRFMFKETAK